MTSDVYREKLDREGIDFIAAPPDLSDVKDESEMMRKAMDRFGGTRYVIQDLVLPHLKRNHQILYDATSDADLLISHPLTFAVPIVAEQRRLPWIGTSLQPMVMLSAYDPPIFGQMPWLGRLPLGPRFHRMLLSMMKSLARRLWAAPIEQLRTDVGLSKSKKNPLLDGMFSEDGNLAMFSQHFAGPQPDWPNKTRATGFLFHDKGREAGQDCMSPELTRFLEAGEPPIVFTLGSSAVMTAGKFYQESFMAAKELGTRAVLLIGKDERNRPIGQVPESILIENYAPYSMLFPRCAAVVHQGGVGTTAQVLRAGKPMMIVPFSHDQPDHAFRIQKLGLGTTLARSSYTSGRVVGKLREILDGRYDQRAKELGLLIQREDGVDEACRIVGGLVENMLNR